MTKVFRVLLVEDNEADAYLTRETLEAGKLPLEVAVATDGAEACDYLLRRAPFEVVALPDLVILDLNLPKLDGRQVLEERQRHPWLRSIPVIILTSSDAEGDIRDSYALGANCYVTKPVGLGAYQATVRAVEDFWLSVAELPR